MVAKQVILVPLATCVGDRHVCGKETINGLIAGRSVGKEGTDGSSWMNGSI